MNTQTKVVDLKTVRPSTTAEAVVPANSLAMQLRDASVGQLKRCLQALFDSVDDTLYELSDRNSSEDQRKIYFDAMREIRLQRKDVAKAFLVSLVSLYRSLGVKKVPVYGSADAQNGSQGLSLLDDNALEIQVALETMANKCRNRDNDVLACLDARIALWLKKDELDPFGNPFSPEALCHAFANALSSIQLATQIRLVVLKLFEKHVLTKYEELAELANRLMASQGILPNLKSSSDLRDKPSSSGSASAANNPTGGSNAPVNAQEGSAPAWNGNNNYSGQGFGTIVSLDENILKQLSSLQHAVPGTAQAGASYGLQDFQRIWSDSLSKAGLLSSSEQHENTINLVSMLFEFVLDDRQLQPTMKALIARLQIPILKVALMDQSFFSSKGHPARKLLNEISKSAIGWVERQDGRKDLFREKVEAIVYRLLNEFEHDPRVFAEILADFEKFTDVERRRLELIEQRVKDAEEGKAVSELAQHIVDSSIQAVLRDFDVPQEAVALIEGGWRQVMMLNYLRHGQESAEWQTALCTLKDLGWSLDPQVPHDKVRNMSFRMQLREQLLHMIPGVLKRVRSGLTECGVDKATMDHQLNALKPFHLNALQNLTTIPEDEEVAVVDERSATAEISEVVFEEVALSPEPVDAPDSLSKEDGFSMDDWLSDASDFVSASEALTPVASEIVPPVANPVDPGALSVAVETSDGVKAEAQYYSQVDGLRVGAWLEYHAPGEDKLRCKLAAQIRASGKYIFVNRNGIKVREFNRDELAGALAQGTMRLLEEGLLFDRALESVIGSLRKQGRHAL
ncbi:MAG: DUF1631 domain-containing protein [Hahellaceae bacterium]|nr:DUF1631 domain-containing protein [Hahellaceae bacterium]